MDKMKEIGWKKKCFNSNAMWNETKQKNLYNIVAVWHTIHQPANVMVTENGSERNTYSTQRDREYKWTQYVVLRRQKRQNRTM